MKLVLDKEARALVEQMCDICLKQGGLRNLQPITMILSNIELFDPPSVAVPEEEIKQEKSVE